MWKFSIFSEFLGSSVGTRWPSPTSVYFFLHFLVKNYHKKGKSTSFLLFVHSLMYLPEPELLFCPTTIKNASARHTGWQVASLWGTWALLFTLRRSLIHHLSARIYYHQLSRRRFCGPPFVQLSSNTPTKGLGDLHRELFLDVVQEEQRVECSIPPRAGYKNYPSLFKGMDAFLGSNICTAVATCVPVERQSVKVCAKSGCHHRVRGNPWGFLGFCPVQSQSFYKTLHSGERCHDHRCHQNSPFSWNSRSESQRNPQFNMVASFITN